MIVVCGSRGWRDEDLIRRVLAELVRPGELVVHGDAQGADRLAAGVARDLGCRVEAMPADWQREGRRAGYVRNLAMLDRRPRLVVGFQLGGTPGTAHTLKIARRRGIEVVEVGPSGRVIGAAAR